jgi:hypothetical protein
VCVKTKDVLNDPIVSLRHCETCMDRPDVFAVMISTIMQRVNVEGYFLLTITFSPGFQG